MPLVNHTLTNLSQGVSQQHEESRYESQVAEMVNCMPDVSRGIFRRNPTESLNISFYTNSDIGSFSYTYDRGTDNEQYLINVEKGPGVLNVVNLSSNSKGQVFLDPYLATSTPSTSITAMTIGDFTFITNSSITPSMSNTISGSAGNLDKVGVYWIKETTQVEIKVDTQGSNDTTTNTSSTVSDYEGFTYTLKDKSVKAERTHNADQSVNIDRLSAPSIATKLALDLGSDYESDGSFVYYKGNSALNSWEWSDTGGSLASFGFSQEVEDAAKLPAAIPDAIVDYYTTKAGGLFVYVSGGSDDNIGYWLKYKKGVGWVESLKPGQYNEIDADTMPHVLIRKPDGYFAYGPYTSEFINSKLGTTDSTLGWKDRKYGDGFTAKEPSFIGQPIQDIFFYQNRLGFVAGDSVVMSGTSDYGNFWPTSVRAAVDTDVIDLTIATRSVTTLSHSLEISDRLIVFSKDTQFHISSTEGPISPANATVTIASNYNIDVDTKPIVIGDSAYFTSTLGESTHLYKYSFSNLIANKLVATDVTMHCPSYIPKGVTKLVGHSTLGYVLMYGNFPTESNSIYIYNGTMIGEDNVQNAVHKWVFNTENITENYRYLYSIIGIDVIQNKLVISLRTKQIANPPLANIYRYSEFVTLSLEVPTDYTTITYMDDELGDYSSSILLSEWMVKDQEKLGTKRGRLQIRTLLYSIDDDSYYSTKITNKNLLNLTNTSVIKTGNWDDSETWNDNAPWADDGYQYYRIYSNDDLITVSGNSKDINIEFKEDEDNPTKGFNLKTINLEGLFYQRSQRY